VPAKRQLLWAAALLLAAAGCASGTDDAVGTSPAASAAASPGQALARHWCAECHNIEPDGSRSRNRRAPAFAKLAADPSFTDYTLRATLRTQHATMPQIMFTPAQLDDIVAYILSLK
jgi:mono/diheme cytochrome c family protein